MGLSRIGVHGALCCMSILSGCAILKSEESNQGGEGVAYQLPRAVLPVQLVFDGSGFDLTIQAAKMVGDPARRYVLQRTGNIFTSDNVAIAVDETSLLKTVTVSSEDKSASTLINLIAGIRARKAESGSAGDATRATVFAEDFDPAWGDNEVAAFNERLSHAARGYMDQLLSAPKCNPRKEVAAPDAAKAAAALEDCAAVWGVRRTLQDREALSVSVPRQKEAPASIVDCTRGLCYRINTPVTVTLKASGMSSSSMIGLPNVSPTYVLPLERWAFVKTTHSVTLKEGVLQSATTDRPSSAAVIGTLPLDIAKAVLNAISEVVQLKIDLSGKEKALIEARVKELEAQKSLEEAIVKNSKAESALFGDPTLAPRLSLRLGAPRAQADATKNLQSGNPMPAPAASGGGQTASGSAGTGVAIPSGK